MAEHVFLSFEHVFKGFDLVVAWGREGSTGWGGRVGGERTLGWKDNGRGTEGREGTKRARLYAFSSIAGRVQPSPTSLWKTISSACNNFP